MSPEKEEKSPGKARLSQELRTLQNKLLELAELAAAAMEKSIRAVLWRDADLARQVIAGDAAVNNLEEAITHCQTNLLKCFHLSCLNHMLAYLSHMNCRLGCLWKTDKAYRNDY